MPPASVRCGSPRDLRPAACVTGVVAAGGQDTRAGSAQATRTTMVGCVKYPRPARSTSGSAHPQLAQLVARRLDLLGDRGALHRHQGARGRHQRHRPAQQPLQRGHGPGGDHVEASAARAAPRPGRGPPRRGRAPSSSTDLLEEGGAAQQRLDQRDREVGPRDRQHQAGQAGAGADVADRRRRRGSARRARRSSAGAGPTAAAPRAGRSGRGPPRRSASRSAYRSASGQPLSREHPPRHVGRGGCFT